MARKSPAEDSGRAPVQFLLMNCFWRCARLKDARRCFSSKAVAARLRVR